MASTITSSQSNRAALGCGETHHIPFYTVMSIWLKISEECFQQLVESVPQRFGVEGKLGTSKVYIHTGIYMFMKLVRKKEKNYYDF